MDRSFDLVDWKLAEADFFLGQISQCDELFSVRYYSSAFVSSARSVTFAIQACSSRIPRFSEWYIENQANLKQNPLAKFFNEFRRINQHIGESPIRGASHNDGAKTTFWFEPCKDFSVVPEIDVESACRDYFVIVVSLVFDCYLHFGPYIDPMQHYTSEHFLRLNKTIEDAEVEVYGIRGWTQVPSIPEAYRWQAIRDSQPGNAINHLFGRYLNRSIPVPERLPELPWPEGDGWFVTGNGARVWIPPEDRISDNADNCLDNYIKKLRRNRR